MPKKYRVTLSTDERADLEGLLARGKADVRRLKHAQILLKADEADDGPAWSDERIADALNAGTATVERVRQRFVEEGLASALSPYRGGKRIYSRKLDGAQEAHLVALACSKPPEGRGRWTLRLLARRMVELAYVDSVSYETVRQTLKKERAQATSEADVVHPRKALGRVRLPHGGRAGGLSSAARPEAPGGVRGRDLHTADWREP
jgi:transposase